MRPSAGVAIVTGSNSGIGRAIAGALAGGGVDIGITLHCDAAGAEKTAAAVRSRGRHAQVRQLDLTALPAAADVIDELAAALGGLDVLVNNAGVIAPAPGGRQDREPRRVDRIGSAQAARPAPMPARLGLRRRTRASPDLP